MKSFNNAISLKFDAFKSKRNGVTMEAAHQRSAVTKSEHNGKPIESEKYER